MFNTLLARFSRYTGIGVINTALHWCVFMLATALAGMAQPLANLLAFLFAASFSYLANARLTFGVRTRLHRYVVFLAMMGALSVVVGGLGEYADLPLWLTPILFSSLSLLLGFLLSHFVIFRPDP